MPFMAFFEPVNHATQRNSWPLPSAEVALMADLDAVLVTSLLDPGDALCHHHPGRRGRRGPAGVEQGEHDQAHDLQGLADRQHTRDAEARGQPAAAEIGGDTGGLVEQEQEGEREGRVAEPEEVQQHQHAQRPVDQGETPIRGRDDGVVAQHRRHPSASITVLARSTMRHT
jgi:hypothetical protein